MLVRAQDGKIYNLAHAVEVRVSECTDEERELAEEKLRFYVEVLFVRYGDRLDSQERNPILARTEYRAEADLIMQKLVRIAGGVDLMTEV